MLCCKCKNAKNPLFIQLCMKLQNKTKIKNQNQTKLSVYLGCRDIHSASLRNFVRARSVSASSAAMRSAFSSKYRP